MPHGGFGGDTPEDREAAAEQRHFLTKHNSH
jgi:epsilon-lactone hydrolase